MREHTRRHVILGLGRGTLTVAILAMSGCASGSAGSSATTPSESASAGTLSWKRVNLGFVSAYVLIRDQQAAVVDTGVAGSVDAIDKVLTAAGPGWSGVKHVILTHRHPDHVGSLGDVLARATAATGYIGEADLSQVSSPRPLKAVADADEIFGLQVVATPGHTLGHISVFDPGSGVLVAGDALTNTAGLAGSNPAFTDDDAAAAQSVRRLSQLPVRTILFGHGEPLSNNAAGALQQLAGKQ